MSPDAGAVDGTAFAAGRVAPLHARNDVSRDKSWTSRDI
jgi:hypothetical protein